MAKLERYEFAEKSENFVVNEFIKNGYNAERLPFKSAAENHIIGDWVLMPNQHIEIYIEQKTSYGNHCISFNVEDADKHISVRQFIEQIQSDFIIGLSNYGKQGYEEYILYKMDEFKSFILNNLDNEEFMDKIIRCSNDDPEHNPRYINLLNGTLLNSVRHFTFSGPNAIKNMYNKIIELVIDVYPFIEKQNLF